MEELQAFAKERSFKRKLMEVQVGSGGNGSYGGGGPNGQVRRVHIVYFLSRNGSTEHPHLFRVHHLSRNGVYLRDVKSWLSELRGNDMPESFAWSYKRRYKGGYVWQDLLDEDLITPICDNEYVLKGSEISSRTLNNDIISYGEKEVSKSSSPFEVKVEDPKYPSIEKEYPQDFSTNTSIEIEESSFGSNVTTEDTTKNQDEDKDEREVQTLKDNIKNNSFYETLLDKNTNNNNNSNSKSKSKKGGNKSVTSCFEAPPSPTYSFGKPSRFLGSRASHMFRNWITCGTANAHETAVVVVNRRNGSRTSRVSLDSENNGKEYNMGQICKEQKLRGFEKSFDTKDGSKKSKKEDSNSFKTFPPAYKPVNGPNCSQCGRQFKPEKLHTHMKYCRGMKGLAKSTNPSPKPNRNTATPYSPSTDNTFYLTNN